MQWSETEKYGCRSWCWQQCCAFFPFDFQTAVSTASEDVAAECAGGEEQKPKIALTFDDGPNIKYTPMLLDGLKERGIKATFFLIGANTEQEESKKIVKRMYEEGHLIGNHTYRHVDLSKISGREAEKEIKTTDEAIKKITGHETEFIRPPFGAMPEGEEDPDKIYVKWTVDSLDWVTKTRKNCRESNADTKKRCNPMHDCYGESVEAALQIVDIMENKDMSL